MADLDAARTKLGELERANPNRLNLLRALIEIDNARASIFQTRDDWLSAVVAYENNARVLRLLRNADPKNASLTSQLASALRDLALASTRMFDLATRPQVLHGVGRAVRRGDADQPGQHRHHRERDARPAVRGLLPRSSKATATARSQKLDRAAEIGDALVLQRGADADGVLVGVTVRAARARLRNLEGQPKAAAADLERAEYLLGAARPPGRARGPAARGRLRRRHRQAMGLCGASSIAR